MATTYNLKEIANKFAKKQAVMADDLTEDAPILARVKWETASHGLWNMAEKLNDITGAGFVNADAALSLMNTSSDLIKTDLTVLGGYMEQAEDTIDQFGGAAAYFAMKEPAIMKQAGMDTEVKLYYDNWMAKAVADGNKVNAGATGSSVYSIIVLRMEAGVNIGLFDPTQFDSGSLIKRDLINNGARYHLRSKTNVIGYGVTLKGRFGWQNISDRNVGVIANITASYIPTATMIDDMIADVRGTPSNTILLMHPKCRNFLGGFKASPLAGGIIGATDKPQATNGALTMGPGDMNFAGMIESWNGIPIVTSYNILDAGETAISFS